MAEAPSKPPIAVDAPIEGLPLNPDDFPRKSSAPPPVPSAPEAEIHLDAEVLAESQTPKPGSPAVAEAALAALPGVVADPRIETQQRLEQALPAIAMLLLGTIVLSLSGAFGYSVFQGLGTPFSAVADGLGIAAIVTAGARLLLIGSKRIGRRNLQAGAATVVLSYAAAFGINLALAGTTPRPEPSTNQASAVTADGQSWEARSYLSAGHRFVGSSQQRASRIVGMVYAAGATEVSVPQPSVIGRTLVADAILIELPEGEERNLAIAGIASRLEEALGTAINEVDTTPPSDGPWHLVLGQEDR